MDEEHGFEFDPTVISAEAREESATIDATNSNSAHPDNDSAKATSEPLIEPGERFVVAFQAKFDGELQAEIPDCETQLLLLGAALYTYDVWSLSALLENADADPDPPEYVEAVLPFTRRLVDR